MRYEAEKLMFQGVEAAGVKGLLTCDRVQPDSVPKDLYLYEVRHDDDCQGIPAEVGKHIMVNFWGTLLTAQKLDGAEEQGYLLLKEDDWVEEDTRTCSLDEWLNKRYSEKM